MSFNKLKCDSELGREVENHLRLVGVATPMAVGLSLRPEITDEEKIGVISSHFHTIMTTMGLDMSDDSLIDTPNRVAKMFVREIFWGLDPDNFPKCTVVENKMAYDEMVVEKNINVMSNCEHHFVVIDGLATVGYIPKNKVLGLSKLNRIVEYFSKRPQIQERLTEQVFHALAFILGTDDIGVIIDAEHYCVKSRGVEDVGSSTVTSKLGGAYKNDPTVRNEFMNIANRA